MELLLVESLTLEEDVQSCSAKHSLLQLSSSDACFGAVPLSLGIWSCCAEYVQRFAQQETDKDGSDDGDDMSEDGESGGFLSSSDEEEEEEQMSDAPQ